MRGVRVLDAACPCSRRTGSERSGTRQRERGRPSKTQSSRTNANTPSREVGRNYNVRGHSQRGRERAEGPQRGAKSGGEAGIGEVGGDRNVRVVVCCVRVSYNVGQDKREREGREKRETSREGEQGQNGGA